MKEIRVNGIRVNGIVQLNSVPQNAKLTPGLVRRALHVMFGHTRVSANVHDGERGYSVTPRRIRLMSAVEEYEAGVGD